MALIVSTKLLSTTAAAAGSCCIISAFRTDRNAYTYMYACMFYDLCMQGIRRNVAVFMAFTTIIKCLRRFACCGQVLISNQYVSLFYELNLYEDKVQTTIMLYVCI